jgi:glycosyltransferase involved in cell wall biosynthesis
MSQTLQDLEIIMIDDGSTDDTESVIMTGYPHIRYCRRSHKGVSAARNYGISIAEGEFVAFLDADDKWLPEKLEKQLRYFNENADLGMVFTENLFFDGNGLVTTGPDKRKRLMRGDIVRNIFLNSYVVTSTVMVRREVFGRIGLFEEGLVTAEDDNMWMRIAMRYRIALIDEPLVLYRINGNSLTSHSHYIFSGVRNHIEIVGQKYPELYRHLGKAAINRKYADLLFNEAYYQFSQANFGAPKISA